VEFDEEKAIAFLKKEREAKRDDGRGNGEIGGSKGVNEEGKKLENQVHQMANKDNQ